MKIIKKKYNELKIEIQQLYETIFLVKLIGRMTIQGADFTFKELNHFVNDQKVIVIFDLLEINSITPKAMRTYLKDINSNIIYRIYINIPNLYKEKIENIFGGLDTLIVKKSYQEALKFALNMIDKNSIKKEWKYNYKDFRFNIKVLSDNILYVKYFGSANYDKTLFFIKKLQSIIENKKKLVIIQDLEEINHNTFKSRTLLIRTFGNDPKIVGSIYIGASDFQKIKIKTVSLYPMKTILEISDSYQNAIDRANKLLKEIPKKEDIKKINYKHSKILNYLFYQQNQDFIKKINKYLVSIDWHDIEKNEKEINWSNNPFNTLFNSFSIMIADIKELIQSFKYKEKELLHAQNELKKKKYLLEEKVERRKYLLEEINLKLIKEIREKKRSENKIRKSKDIAQRDNMTKTLFLANVSDKLKLSVENVCFHIDKMNTKKEINREDIKINLQNIIKLSEQLSIDILDLITHSQIESGKIVYKIKRHNFSKIVKNSIEKLNYLSIEKNIEIILLDETNNKIFNFDKNQITEVVNNLLSNAIKYSSKNSKITISIKISKDKLFFSIKDSGIGILQSKITSIFEDFTTNVGLIISKKIISYHKGEIWVKNNKDKGVIFIFTLPIF